MMMLNGLRAPCAEFVVFPNFLSFTVIAYSHAQHVYTLDIEVLRMGGRGG
jgi:hypothetical protein